MARIRSIHPDFWTDEATLELSIEAKLFLIGIWNETDDGGAFAWKPKQLKARILPADNIDVLSVLHELVINDIVQHYEVDNKQYGAVRNFGKFQSPKRPKRHYPMPRSVRSFCDTEDIPGEEVSEEPQNTNARSKGERTVPPKSEPVPPKSEPVPLGEEGRGEEYKKNTLTGIKRKSSELDISPPPNKPKPKKRTNGFHRIPDDWQLTEKLKHYSQQLGLSPEQQARSFFEYWYNNKTSKSFKKSWDMAFMRWCDNSVKFNAERKARMPRETASNRIGRWQDEAIMNSSKGFSDAAIQEAFFPTKKPQISFDKKVSHGIH